jgi:Zn-dependent peptidase ImmA (M78 family)
MKKDELAKAAGISLRALSEYLNGRRVPRQSTLVKLAEAVHFPVEFLLGDPLSPPSREAVSFRAKTTMSARQRDQALASAVLGIQLVEWLDTHISLPLARVPQLRGTPPEIAAETVRDLWGLGQDPVPHVIQTLEDHGISVFALADEVESLDGYSFWNGDRPYVFLNTLKSGERSRMDAAHELGHLVLHSWDGSEDENSPTGALNSRDAEREANAFAAAFLMPRRSLTKFPLRPLALGHILAAKSPLGVSAVALVHRHEQLGLLTKSQAREFWTSVEARSWRTTEPAPIARESSTLIPEVLRQLRLARLDARAIARELHIPLDELRRLLFGLTPAEDERFPPPTLAPQLSYDLRLMD